MTLSINKQQAFAALDTFAGARVKLVADLKAAGCTLETARDVVIEWACSKTKGTFTVKANGAVKLDSSHAKYNTTKCIVRDMMLMIQGSTRRQAVQAKSEPVDVVAKLAKQAATLSAADKRRLIKLLSA